MVYFFICVHQVSKYLRASRKFVDLCAYAQNSLLFVYLPPGLGVNEGKYPKVFLHSKTILIQLF